VKQLELEWEVGAGKGVHVLVVVVADDEVVTANQEPITANQEPIMAKQEPIMANQESVTCQVSIADTTHPSMDKDESYKNEGKIEEEVPGSSWWD
jgi:hypothetical protein